MLYMVTFTISISQMLAYIPYMDPMGTIYMTSRLACLLAPIRSNRQHGVILVRESQLRINLTANTSVPGQKDVGN